MITSFVEFGRRQLHTVVTREIIKPSSPIPSNHRTYNLSLLDQLAPDAYLPLVMFFQNSKTYNNFGATMLNIMKKSLSQTLVHYYPFAGRLSNTTPSFVECNDEGVEFLEAHNDKMLSDFLNNMQHEDLDQLFPNGLIWKKLRDHSLENDSTSPLAVQINWFSCGGIAVAVSLSHKVADGSSLCHFLNDWATMTRLWSNELQTNVSPIHPKFISFEDTNINYQGVSLAKSRDSSVTRSFVFPTSKINYLKSKVVAMSKECTDLTRLEVLNWLLYNCSLQAATHTDLGSSKPAGFALVTNIRNKMIEPLPKTTMGNFYKVPSFSTEKLNITPGNFISQLRKLKMEVQHLQNIKEEVEVLQHVSPDIIIKEEQRKLDDYYLSTSLCRYPLYGIDFGWGKPNKVAIAGTLTCNSFLLIDAQNDDGIEVFVSLGREDMEIFEKNNLLCSICL